MKRKTTITITLSKEWYDSQNSHTEFIKGFCREIEGIGIDGNLDIDEILDDGSVNVHWKRNDRTQSFHATDTDDFLRKYARHWTPYDLARVILDYGHCELIEAKTEEIPEPPKEEACSGT